MIVGLEEAKKYLRIDHDEDDEEILSLIYAAEEQVNKDINRTGFTEAILGFSYPYSLRLAAKILINTYYENREMYVLGISVKEIPNYQNLISRYKRYTIV